MVSTETAQQTFDFEQNGIKFSISIGGRSFTSFHYDVVATNPKSGDVYKGDFSFGALSPDSIFFNHISFYNPPTWLTDSQAVTVSSYSEMNYLVNYFGEYPPTQKANTPELATLNQAMQKWVLEDYSRRFWEMVVLCESGVEFTKEQAADYGVWRIAFKQYAFPHSETDYEDRLNRQEVASLVRLRQSYEVLGKAEAAHVHLRYGAEGHVKLSGRVDSQTWKKIAPYFTHITSEDAEDMGMFDFPTGWYISGGPTENVKVEKLLGVPPHLALTALVEATEDKDAARKKILSEAGSRIRSENEENAHLYEEWLTDNLAGLVVTSVTPALAEGTAWERVAHFSKYTPGTWPTTGDTYYQGTVAADGSRVYKREYGNATTYHLSSSLYDKLCFQVWRDVVAREGYTEAARNVLLSKHRQYFGQDTFHRLLELQSPEFFTGFARQEPWIILPKGCAFEREGEEQLELCRTYNLPYVEVEFIREVHYSEKTRNSLSLKPGEVEIFPKYRISADESFILLTRHPDGRVLGYSDKYRWVETKA